jgi:hypothetical protein
MAVHVHLRIATSKVQHHMPDIVMATSLRLQCGKGKWYGSLHACLCGPEQCLFPSGLTTGHFPVLDCGLFYAALCMFGAAECTSMLLLRCATGWCATYEWLEGCNS